MDPLEILSRIGTDDAPTDEELRTARSEFKTSLRNAVEARELAEAASIRQAIELVDDELAARAAADAQEAAEAEALLEGIEDDDELAARAAADAAETAEAEALLEGIEVDDETDAEVEDDEDDAEPEPETETSGESADPLEAIRAANRNARARIDAEAQPENPYPDVRITGIGQAALEQLDHTTSTRDVASIFAQYARGRNRGRDTLVRMTWDLPEDRRLDGDSDQNHRLIEEVVGQGATTFEAVAASGGICGPLPALFEIPLIGARGRPVRDALVRFGADRGGVRYIAAPRPSQSPVDGAVAVWTAENDASPASPAEKPCPHVDCKDECEVTVDAVTACLTVGNFLARFSPEQWGNALGQLGILHDRTAEQNILAQIDALSIATTFDGGGTIQSVLGAVDRAVAAIRSRERLSDATGFRAILDGWLRNALRDHFTRQRPAGQTGAPGVADAAVAAWFGARGVSVTYTSDDAIIGAQSAGALLDFPSATDIRIFPEGTYLFLDGGTLDLGTEIVDSDLIATNDRLAFMETFEGVAKRTAPCDDPGDDSLVIRVDIDPGCICLPEAETSP